MHFGWQIQDVLPACESNRVELPVQFVEVVVVDDLVILIAAHHGEVLAEAVERPAEDRRDQ